MEFKKVIVCDLDGTLARSKSSLTPEMAVIICRLLDKHYLAVVSGGAFGQFQKQFLSSLSCAGENLKNLSIFPTMGSTCFVYDLENKAWKMLYQEQMTEEERAAIKKAFEESIAEFGVDLSGAYGQIVEDRGTQVTFSGRGQEAPVEIKEAWDPDQEKRKVIIGILKKKIPGFDVNIGGSTSIDVTRSGVDKAYAIKKIKELLKVEDEDISFIGDALYKGGNDSAVKKTNVDYFQPSGPEETMELFHKHLDPSF